MIELGTIRVTPVAYRVSGYVTVPEGEQDWFSVTIYEDAKGYGRGWFPKYNFGNADAYDYMYKTKARAYEAAGLEMPKTKTIMVTADSSVMLRHSFEVPANATDEEIHALCEALDGGEFEEVANSGDWSQTWNEV